MTSVPAPSGSQRSVVRTAGPSSSLAVAISWGGSRATTEAVRTRSPPSPPRTVVAMMEPSTGGAGAQLRATIPRRGSASVSSRRQAAKACGGGTPRRTLSTLRRTAAA